MSGPQDWKCALAKTPGRVTRSWSTVDGRVSDVLRTITCIGAIVSVSACTSASEEDLQAWAEQIRANARPKSEEVRPPAVFEPQKYLKAQELAPFNEERLVVALRAETRGAASSVLQAEQRRKREELEEFPLDTMSMVGVMEKARRRVAILKVNGMLYTVGVGNYIGQNYGRITSITEKQVVLREIVQDPSGEWVERQTTLELQEGGEK